MHFLAALLFVHITIAATMTTNLSIRRRLSIHITNGTTGNCDALVEESDWAITNFAAFQAIPSPNSISYVAFSFEDVNLGLGLITNCSHYQSRGSNATTDDDSYHLCASHDVHFKYSGQVLQVERWYQDPCLGPAPYDSAVAHGRANVTSTKTRAQDGVLVTQISMDMPITSLS